jgi:hypothetical protein
MAHNQYIKFGILSWFILMGTLMIGQTSVFAQITPAPEKFNSNDVGGGTTDSSHNTGTSNENPQGITPSAVTDQAAEDSTVSTYSSDVSSGQTTIKQDDGALATEEQDPDPTNQLAETIINKVDKVLSAAGIISP